MKTTEQIDKEIQAAEKGIKSLIKEAKQLQGRNGIGSEQEYYSRGDKLSMIGNMMSCMQQSINNLEYEKTHNQLALYKKALELACRDIGRDGMIIPQDYYRGYISQAQAEIDKEAKDNGT